MRRIWIVLMVLVGGVLFKGCSSIEEYDVVKYKAPNWTSDGTIVFVKDHNHVKDKKSITGEEGNIKGSSEKLILCEINNDGTGFKEIATMLESNNYAYSLGITNTSSAGEWVVMGMKAENDSKEHIYIIKRDGTGLSKICEGNYPDFSPDAEKIVYQKPDQGLWIMNRDGSREHQIISEGQHPAWSPDGGRIGYSQLDSSGIWIADTAGNYILNWEGDSIVHPVRGVSVGNIDWGPLDSNTVITEGARIAPEVEDGFIVLYLGLQDYVFTSIQAYKFRLSPDGVYFSAYDSGGDFVSTFGNGYSVDFDTKWYLKP
jgi:uncharacterized protein YceK